MQEEVDNQSMAWGHSLKIRIGFHYGDVIQEAGDVFGDAVNLAARMAAQAKADQIITTGETRELMNRMLQMDTRLLITLTFQGRQIEVGQELPSATLGRGKQNHFMVPDTMSSRIHARIEFRRDRFILVDQSTNGTFVVTSGQADIFVHRDERRIDGDGVIGLGRKVLPNDPLAVYFHKN